MIFSRIISAFLFTICVQLHPSSCGARATREVKEFCMTISELISLGFDQSSTGEAVHKPARSRGAADHQAPPLRAASSMSAPVAQLAQAAVVSKAHLQQAPARAAAKISALSTQGACTAQALAPLAALYARTFGKGHTKKQAREVTRFLLPITLEPEIVEEYMSPCGFLRFDKNLFFWEDEPKSHYIYPVEDDYENVIDNIPWKLREPISRESNPKNGMEFSVHYDSQNAHITKTFDSQTGPRDSYALYVLPDQKDVRAMKWFNARNRLLTLKFDQSDDPKKGTYKQTAFAWNFQPFETFTQGIIASEQLMLISLLHDVQKKNHVPLSLSDCAVLAQEPGVTTAELARVLLSFHPALKNHILNHMHISTKQEGAQQPEDYLERYQAFEQARDIVLGQAHDPTALLNTYDAINKALEEYIVDERPNHKRYVNLFVRIRSTQTYYDAAMVELADAIQSHDLKRVHDNLNYRTVGGSIKFITRMCCGETSWASIPLLHEAIRYWDPSKPKSDEIFKAILHYQEQLVPDCREWKAYKYSFKDALLYALELKKSNCAIQIAQKMMLDPELCADTKPLLQDHAPLMRVMAVLGGNSEKK